MVQSLPFGGQKVAVPGFGAMGLSAGMGSNLQLDQAEPVLLKAVELGCTFWDTAVSQVKPEASRREKDRTLTASWLRWRMGRMRSSSETL